MKKFLMAIFVGIISIIGIINVNAVDQTIIFHNSTLKNVNKIYNAGTTYKEVTTSEGVKIAYCFNKKLQAPPTGSKLVATNNDILPNAVKTNQYIYILDNGYGGSWNENVIGKGNYSNHEKYYITQLALWMAQGELSPETIKSSGKLGTAAYNLYNAAVKNSSLIAYEPEINLTGKLNMTLKDDSYLSDVITLNVSGNDNADVKLVNAPAGSYIVVNGENKGNSVTLNNGTKFQVSIPKNKVLNTLNFKVNVTTTATRKKIQIYKYNQSNEYQNIGLIFKDNYTAKKEITGQIVPTGTLIIEKVELINGKDVDLKGATLVLKDENGNQIAKWNTTDENPKKFTNLKIGSKYTISEEKAPEGYKKISDLNVQISSSAVRLVKVRNTKYNKVYISKQDITNKQELPGAKLIVKDSLGNTIDEWVSTDTPHYINKELLPGTYYLTEIQAPEGYALSTEKISFTVNADGKVDKDVVMYNTPVKGIKISKQDVTTSKELPGATLVLKDSEGKVIDEWVSTTEPHYIANLKEGTYTLIETKSPKGYGLSDEVITFEIKYDGKPTETVVMYNSQIPDTQDINVKLVVFGLISAIGLGTFGFMKFSKQA